MLPINPWSHQNAIKTLYSNCVAPVCEQYHLTRMELDILLFLANNPQFDTATDIVELRYLSKSQVSASVQLLEKKGLTTRCYYPGNRKTAHLKLTELSAPMVQAGQAAQREFGAILTKGFTEEELAKMQEFNQRIQKNIDCYFQEETL